MKKWWLALVILVVLSVVSVYVFIPNVIIINQQVTVSTSQPGLYRSLFKDQDWRKWWPADTSTTNGQLAIGKWQYTIDDKTLSSFNVSVRQDQFNYPGLLHLISNPADSNTTVEYRLSIPSSYNPINRFRAYQRAKEIRANNSRILSSLRDYYAKPEHVYGFNILQVPITDSILISTYAVINYYPGIDFVYQLIDQLKDYIQKNAAREAGYPMMNISTADSLSFLVKVAIPVDRILPSSGKIEHKFMPGRKRILTAEVTGGPKTIEAAIPQFENYIRDYKQSSPAIPFLSLVTNRIEQPDSSRWVTRIYYPVMLW